MNLYTFLASEPLEPKYQQIQDHALTTNQGVIACIALWILGIVFLVKKR
jgi:hypothetical protein